MFGYNRITVQKCIVILVLFLALILGLVIVEAVNAKSPAHNGSSHGNGGRPEWAGGKRDRNDPDDDGRGPDRGDGTRDNEDFNNGCGNDEDRTDDNEGLCGGRKPVRPYIPPPEEIPTEIVETKMCKLVVWGWTPEVFEAGQDLHDGAVEANLIAEAHGYLEVTLPMGFRGAVLWYNGSHATSLVTGFVCDQSEIVLYEPFDRFEDWVE